MQIVNEMIKKVSEIKANAARKAAEKIVINDIVFEEGIQPGEVKLESRFHFSISAARKGGRT